jgi:hypothetical protein
LASPGRKTRCNDFVACLAAKPGWRLCEVNSFVLCYSLASGCTTNIIRIQISEPELLSTAYSPFKISEKGEQSRYRRTKFGSPKARPEPRALQAFPPSGEQPNAGPWREYMVKSATHLAFGPGASPSYSKKGGSNLERPHIGLLILWSG